MIPTRKLLVCLFLFCLGGAVLGQGFLKADGRLIVNEKGSTVILRGIGLGGWMLQEGYMLKLGKVGPQHKIREKITELVGPGKAADFYDRWLANDIRKIDIDSMAAWGFNSVRLPMHYELYTLAADQEPVSGKDTWLQKGFVLTDSLLAWCKADHIYLILDMHAAPGGQGNDLPIADRDPSKPSLWESAANREKMVALWGKLAQRYAGEPWVGGYDIINEPNWGFSGDTSDMHGIKEKGNAPLRKLMVDITAAIRAVDKRHMIIIEGNGWGNNYEGVLPAWDNNMVLSFHKYWNPNTDDAIRRFLDLREKNNIPIWLGESGENDDKWFHDAVRLVESHDIGWCWWPLKKIGTSQPEEIVMAAGFQKLVDFWVNKGPRPTEKEAEDGLNALLQNIRLENTKVHRDVLNALFLP
jgi:endoglucanase